MDFEDFLAGIGGLGPFQRRSSILLSLADATCAFQTLAILFTAATPDYFCKESAQPGSGSVTSALFSDNDGLPVNKTNGTTTKPSKCSVDIISSDTNITKSVTCTEWGYDNTWYDFTIVNQWDLICDQEWLVATAGSLFMVGFLVGSFVFGIISDKFGRKMPFLLATLTQVVVGVATAFSPNYSVFVVFRVTNGIVSIGQLITAFVLCMELVGNTGRSIFGFLMMATWSIAYLVLTGVAYFVREWWKLQIIVTMPSALMLFYYFLIPKSPRWLLLHDKNDEARDIMKKMATANGFPNMDVTKVEAKKEVKGTATYLDLVRTPKLRIRTISMMFIWMTVSLVYYGLTFNTGNLAGNPYVNHAIGATVETASCFLCIWLFEKFGRRFPQFGSLLFCGLAILAMIPVPADLSFVTIILSMTGKFMITASFSMVYIYTAEVFPTVVRNQAVGGGSLAARIGSITAPYIAQLGNNNILIPAITFGICSIVSSVLMLLVMPETKGRMLPDTIEEGENLGVTSSFKLSHHITPSASRVLQVPHAHGNLRQIHQEIGTLDDVAVIITGTAKLGKMPGPSHLSVVYIVLSMTGKFMITASFSMVYVCTAEVFPTVVRNQAVGAGSLSARIGSIAQMGNNNILVPAITFGICSIVSSVLMLLVMPETKGRVLPDTIEEGEKLGVISSVEKSPTKPEKEPESNIEEVVDWTRL